MYHLFLANRQKLRIGVFALFLVWSVSLSAQNYADPKFYLIDSLDLDILSEYDRTLIDTNLQHYHQETLSTVKLSYIEHIVDECWNARVWPQYNLFVYENSYEGLRKSTLVDEQEKFASLLAGSISNLGYIYDNAGNIPSAAQYYHQALTVYELIGDMGGAAASFNNLGVLYSSQGDTAKAMFYHNESLRLKKKLGDERGVSLSLNNIGTLYKHKGRVFEALDCFEKSLRICKRLDDQRGMAISYDNIAGVYFMEGYALKAIQYYQKAYDIRIANDEFSGAAFSLNNIASVYLSQKKYSEAEKYALESYKLSSEIGYPMDIQNSAETLYLLFKQKGDYLRALSYHEEFIRMRDSLYNENNEKALLSQSIRYEYEKKSLKKNLENQKIQAIKDSQINEQAAVINQEKTLRWALIVFLLLMGYLVFISVRNYKRKQQDNILIQKQKTEVEVQKKKIEKQHEILEETYKEISDSIAYAKRIQQAILPPVENFAEYFDDFFVWYLPKNVVSGDFFWLERVGNLVIVAAADCTGHGVPGAMVSVVCHNALNRSVFEFGLNEPADILNKTRELVIETFDRSSNEVKDGMDISMISVDLDSYELNYAGANNNLYLIRELSTNYIEPGNSPKTSINIDDSNNCVLLELKADKQPIGRFSKARPFEGTKIKLEPNDRIYLFSDGLADQFGGPKGKKFKYQQFKDVLLQRHLLSMSTQKQDLESSFYTWKNWPDQQGNPNEMEQVDDICVIGLRIP